MYGDAVAYSEFFSTGEVKEKIMSVTLIRNWTDTETEIEKAS